MHAPLGAHETQLCDLTVFRLRCDVATPAGSLAAMLYYGAVDDPPHQLIIQLTHDRTRRSPAVPHLCDHAAAPVLILSHNLHPYGPRSCVWAWHASRISHPLINIKPAPPVDPMWKRAPTQRIPWVHKYPE